ncbi:MAG: Rrf2 family transcriptional regulator [Phycisphaerae bacterium]|nr:Rrf2 family transcriptional regulator [Phycisphaerae bacterium]
MKLSKKADYALRVLFTLVEHSGRGPIPIRELARRNDAPKRFLEHIMLELKSQGWVSSVPGKLGGYVLARKPEKIAIGAIIRHFDGQLAPIGCVSATHYERCSQEAVCRFRRLMLDIRNQVAWLTERSTLATVYAGEPVTRREVFKPREFIAGDGI